MTIDIKAVARQLADDLQISDKDIQVFREEGRYPSGWTNALMDILESEYELETKVWEELA